MTEIAQRVAIRAGIPPFYTSSQITKTETAGSNTDTTSAYVYAPSQLWLVDRQDAEILIDRGMTDRDFARMESDVAGVRKLMEKGDERLAFAYGDSLWYQKKHQEAVRAYQAALEGQGFTLFTENDLRE